MSRLSVTEDCQIIIPAVYGAMSLESSGITSCSAFVYTSVNVQRCCVILRRPNCRSVTCAVVGPRGVVWGRRSRLGVSPESVRFRFWVTVRDCPNYNLAILGYWQPEAYTRRI